MHEHDIRSPIAHVVVDAGGAITEANAAATALLACAVDDLLGRPLADHLDPSDGTAWPECLAQILTEGSAQCELITLDIHGTALDAGHALLALVDGSATRAQQSRLEMIESRIRHAQKMETIGKLTAGVSHDFNNLLQGISGCTEVALDRLPDDSPAREAMVVIREACSDGMALTRQLLALVREDAAEPAPQAVDRALARCRGLLRRVLGENTELRTELGAADRYVRVGAGAIEQIALNLAINARDAMPDGGVVTIRTRVEEPFVVLEVADTGVGMPEYVLERALEAFYTTKGPGGGTGLGLFTIRCLAEHAGTTVRVYLPACEPKPLDTEPTPGAEEASPLRGAGECVLLVEDDALVRSTVLFCLESAGYKVETARSADEALETARLFRDAIDLVLADVLLPGDGGWPLTRELHRVAPDVPIVYMSAHPVNLLRETGRIEEDASTLQKPFSRTDVLATVRAALSAARTVGHR